MTREEMRRVLGAGTDDLMLDMLEGLGAEDIDVVHSRPILIGPTVLTDENRSELKEAFAASGVRRRFTGYQMTGHRRDVRLYHEKERYYFAPTGGETMVSIKARGRTSEGFAECSQEDNFCRVVGRRLAFTRALLDAVGAEATSPRCQEHSVAGDHPKPRLGTGRSGKTAFPDIGKFAELWGEGTLPRSSRGSLHFLSPGHLIFDDFAGFFKPMTRKARLERDAERKLVEAKELDHRALAAKKKDCKRLRRCAKALREQAIAAAEVARRIESSPEKDPPEIRNEA